jgi:hypothetical protein
MIGKHHRAVVIYICSVTISHPLLTTKSARSAMDEEWSVTTSTKGVGVSLSTLFTIFTLRKQPYAGLLNKNLTT